VKYEIELKEDPCLKIISECHKDTFTLGMIEAKNMNTGLITEVDFGDNLVNDFPYIEIPLEELCNQLSWSRNEIPENI